jgi:hypothetical protein
MTGPGPVSASDDPRVRGAWTIGGARNRLAGDDAQVELNQSRQLIHQMRARSRRTDKDSVPLGHAAPKSQSLFGLSLGRSAILTRIASTVHPQYRVPSLAEITISCIRRRSNERLFEMDDGGNAVYEVYGSVC